MTHLKIDRTHPIVFGNAKLKGNRSVVKT